MRSLVAGLALLVAIAVPARGGIPWERNHLEAFTRAQEKRLPLVIYFTGNPCGKVRDIAETDQRGRAVHGAHRTDCELLEEDVWSKGDVADAFSGFVPVIMGDSQQVILNRRYEVATFPTVLFTDPWGNEIVRLVYYTPKDRVLQVARAIPTDFAQLQPAAAALQTSPLRFDALVAAAAFYERQNLRVVSERYYEKALEAASPPADATLRRGVQIARGTNLLLMGKAHDAVSVFEQARAEAPDGPQQDVLLLGLVMAQSRAGRETDARRSFEDLKQRFPNSPYTKKAAESLAAGNR